MATQIKKVSATETVVLKGPSEWAVGRWIVAIYKSAGAGTFTAKPQKRVRIEGNTPDAITIMPYTDCWWMNALTNSEIAAGTTATDTVIMDIDSSGCDTQIVLALTGENTINFYAVPCVG